METERCSICSHSPSKFSCSCALPSLPICETCLLSHISTAGSHITVPLLPRVTATTETGNEVCDECGNKQADYFCLCSSSLRKFCRECDYSHYQKAPHMVHFKHSMVGYQEVASGRTSIGQFKKKQLYINDLLLQLEDELSNFDTFARRAETEFVALQEKIAARKAEFLREMQSQREKLISAIREVNQNIESKRYVETLEVITCLDDAIVKGYLYPWLSGMSLFVGNINIQPVYRALEEFLEYEVGGILLEKGQAIPVLKDQKLMLYQQPNLQNRLVVLDPPLQTIGSTAYCYIGKSTILCCGGDTSNLVYEVNVQSGKVVQVASMSAAKGNVGIWSYQGKWVFIFGGTYNNKFHNASEKYTTDTKLWKHTAKLMVKAKAYCSVCEHSTGLYIAGNDSDERSIELFDPLKETFVLVLTEPSPGCSIICCVEDNLYQIVKGNIQVANLTAGGLHFTVKGTFPQVGDGNYWPVYPLRSFKGEFMCVFYMYSGLYMYSFNPERLKFIKVS